MKTKMMEKWKKLQEEVTLNDKFSFLVAFLGTFFTHMTFFMNSWANEDSLFNNVVEVNMIGSGRWMPGVVLSQYTTRGVELLIACISLGLIAFFISRLFDFKHKTTSFMVSSLLVTSPVLAMSFGYDFMIERYMMGMLFSVACVFVTEKIKYGFIFGGVLLCLSLGYYQSYIAISMTLCMGLIFLKLLKNEGLKDVMRSALKYIVMGLLGVMMYLFIVKFVYGMLGFELLAYKGIDEMGALPPIGKWGYLLARTYGHVAYYVLGKSFFNPGLLAVIAGVGLISIGLFLTMRTVLSKRDFKRTIVFVSLFILCPLCLNIQDFLMFDSHISSLNIYQFVFLFVPAFIILDNYSESDFKILKSVCLLCGIVVVWSNFSLTNLYYKKMDVFNRETVLLTNRLVARIEEYTDGREEKVLFGNRDGVMGVNNGTKTIFDEKILVDQGLWSPYIGYSSQDDYSDYKIHTIIKNITGLEYLEVGEDERGDIISSVKYEEMPAWPNRDAVAYFDDVLVVKLS